MRGRGGTRIRATRAGSRLRAAASAGRHTTPAGPGEAAGRGPGEAPGRRCVKLAGGTRHDRQQRVRPEVLGPRSSVRATRLFPGPDDLLDREEAARRAPAALADIAGPREPPSSNRAAPPLGVARSTARRRSGRVTHASTSAAVSCSTRSGPGGGARSARRTRTASRCPARSRRSGRRTRPAGRPARGPRRATRRRTRSAHVLRRELRVGQQLDQIGDELLVLGRAHDAGRNDGIREPVAEGVEQLQGAAVEDLRPDVLQDQQRTGTGRLRADHVDPPGVRARPRDPFGDQQPELVVAAERRPIDPNVEVTAPAARLVRSMSASSLRNVRPLTAA